MKHLTLNVQVRPARLAVLQGTSDVKAFVDVIRFASQIWGGKFISIIPTDVQPDDLAVFRLARNRPDFVFGVGIDYEAWAEVVNCRCQPRGFSMVDEKLSHDIESSTFCRFVSIDHALVAFFELRNRRSAPGLPLKLIDTYDTNPLAPYYYAIFGIHHRMIKDAYRDEAEAIGAEDALTLIRTVTSFVEGAKASWLDISGHGLQLELFGRSVVEPAIVLVKDVARDLAYYWNLRSMSEAMGMPWIMPVPADVALRGEILEELSRWLRSFGVGRMPFNYCVVTSATADRDECTEFAAAFNSALQDTCCKAVDYEPMPNRLPVVAPFEYQTVVSGQISDRRLSFVPPMPKAIKPPKAGHLWMVDILSEEATGRAVLEATYPNEAYVADILNGPCPPSHEQSLLRKYGHGLKGLNVACSPPAKVLKFFVPTAEEILQELLLEHGCELLHDEKRSSYLPTIERFGGLHQAAAAFAGQAGTILCSLRQGPLTSPEIRSLCRIGSGHLTGAHYLDRLDVWLKNASPRVKRIARGRFQDYVRDQSPFEMKLTSFLDYYSEKGVLKRMWQVGPCQRCMKKSFVASIDLDTPVQCPNCGAPVMLGDRVQLAYALRRAVKHSIVEGLVPVVLTGRFLKNLSNRGFLWLPGVKFRKGEAQGDVDIVACCDGHIVFAECKSLQSLEADSKAWRRVVDQFASTVEIAIECRADLVVLATEASALPSDVKEAIDHRVGGRIPFLLLAASDLQSGFRKLDQGRYLTLADTFILEYPEQAPEPRDFPRQIYFSGAIYTKG